VSVFSSPAFAPLANLLGQLPPDRFPTHAELNALPAVDARIHFVAPPDEGGNYERRVHASGAVATRADNWHDLFNALVWRAFPQSKNALNGLHVRELAGIGRLVVVVRAMLPRYSMKVVSSLLAPRKTSLRSCGTLNGARCSVKSVQMS